MIRNEAEYKEAVRRLEEERERLSAHRKQLESEGYKADELKRLMDPMVTFHEQLVEEVASYERLSRGQFEEFENLHKLGRILVGLRIARRVSQKELADRLGVHESQVSRDERNEYHGITVERASRVLDALGARLVSLVADQPVGPKEERELATSNG